MKKIIILICFISTCFILRWNEESVQAGIINYRITNTDEQLNVIAPRADIIEIHLREFKGVLQYRRWNATQNRWVDPDWINL